MTRTKALLLCTLLVPSLVAAADDETRLFIDKNPNTGVELYIIDQGGTSSRYDFWILRTVKDGRDLTGRLGNVAHPKDRLEGAASHGNHWSLLCRDESVTIDESRTTVAPMLEGKTLTLRDVFQVETKPEMPNGGRYLKATGGKIDRAYAKADPEIADDLPLVELLYNQVCPALLKKKN